MASNPYVNKVKYNGNTLIDLTGDTVAAEFVAEGKTFHLPSGQRVTGTAKATYNPTTKELTVPSWAVELE